MRSEDALPAVLAGLLYVLLLISLREILSPPLVLPPVLGALWPLRSRPGAQAAIAMAVFLTLAWGLKRYGGLLRPFLLALACAYLLAPLVGRLERRGVKRGLAIVVVILALALGGAVLGFAGLLLAIPIAVLVKLLGTRRLARYRAAAVYRGSPA